MVQIKDIGDIEQQHYTWLLSRLISTSKKFNNNWSNEDLSRMVSRTITAKPRHHMVATLAAKGVLIHTTKQTLCGGRVLVVDGYSLSQDYLDSVSSLNSVQSNTPTQPASDMKKTTIVHTCPHCHHDVSINLGTELIAPQTKSTTLVDKPINIADYF